MRRIVLAALISLVLIPLALSGCKSEEPVVVGGENNSSGGGGGDAGNFDFDVSSGGDTGTDAGDATDDGGTAEDTGVTADVSCTQTNAGIEICDGQDNDCDGVVDNGCDEDGDGFCADGVTIRTGATCEAGDCDDTNAAVNPEADPACDGLDNDCDGDIDELTAVPSMRVTETLDGSYSADSSYPSPILASFTGDGFCFAALDDRGDSLALGHIGANGQTSKRSTDVSARVGVDLLDLSWDGQECAALYREGDQNLKLRRWEPGSTSAVTVQVSQYLSNQGEWESLRNAALWFGDVARCDGSRCTTEPRWVVAYMLSRGTVEDGLVFHTVPQDFEADEELMLGLQIESNNTTNAEVDVAGTGGRGDGFLVVDHDTRSDTSVWSVVEEELMERDELSISDSAVSRALINESGGELYLQLRRELRSGRWETGLNGIATSGYRPEDEVTSSADERFIGREFVSSLDRGGQLFIDPYEDVAYVATPTGTGDRFFDFTELTNPEFDRFTELLAPGSDGAYLWVASLIDESSYEVAVDTFACY